MAEYIEREALKAVFEEDGHLSAYVEEMIDSIPAADVRPVVRGKWEPGDSRNVSAVCSNCGHLRLGNGSEWATKLAHFCEKCGADMRPE